MELGSTIFSHLIFQMASSLQLLTPRKHPPHYHQGILSKQQSDHITSTLKTFNGSLCLQDGTQNCLSSQSRSSLTKERERGRERGGQYQPHLPQNGCRTNKNVCRGTSKAIKYSSVILYVVTVPLVSLIKALEFSQKHKHNHLPPGAIWHPVSGHLWMLKDNPDSELTQVFIVFTLVHGTRVSSISTAFPASQTTKWLSCGQSDYPCRCLKYSSAGSLGTQWIQAENEYSRESGGLTVISSERSCPPTHETVWKEHIILKTIGWIASKNWPVALPLTEWKWSRVPSFSHSSSTQKQTHWSYSIA